MKISKFRLLPSIAALALFAIATQWTLTSSLSAQTEPAAEDAEVVAVDDSKSLIDMYSAGGWAMYPLTLLSVAGFGLIVYNFMAVKPGPILQSEVVPQLEEALQALDIGKAKSICDENPAPTTNIIGAGLARVDLDHYNAEQVKEAVEEASAEELADMLSIIFSGPQIYIELCRSLNLFSGNFNILKIFVPVILPKW